MNYKIIAEVILVSSSIGLGGIIFKKIPVLSALSEKELKKEVQKSKLMGRLKKVKLFKYALAVELRWHTYLQELAIYKYY